MSKYIFTKKAFVFTFLFLLSLRALPQAYESLRFDNYTVENGLSNNQIHCVLQDHLGWIWFGTSIGLNRFDGFKFVTFINNPDKPNSLQGDLARIIFEDTEKNLWIGTEYGGLSLYDRQKEDFIYFPLMGDLSKKKYTVNSITEDRQGIIWLGTNYGLGRLNRKDGRIQLFAHDSHSSNSITDDFVRVVLADKTGDIWIGSIGLDRFTPSTHTFIHVELNDKPLREEIQRLYEDDDGTIWVGTYNMGILIIHPQTLQIEQLVLDPKNDRSRTVRAFIKDKNGYYWIGTRGGGYQYSKQQGIINYFSHDNRDVNSISHNSILNIYSDKRNNLWFGTRSGVSYLVMDKQIFRHYKALPDDNRYLNDNEIFTFWYNSAGKLWIGTDKGGINILDLKSGRFSYLMHSENSLNSISNDCVKAIADDQKGNLWIGTFMGGIDLMNQKTKQFIHYKNNPADPSSLKDNRVWCIFLDSRKNIWVGTEHGIDMFEPVKKSFIHQKHIINNKAVVWINEDTQHDLWFGSDREIVVYNPNNEQKTVFNERSRAALFDSTGKIWVATLDKGIALYDKQKGAVKYYTPRTGLINNQTYGLLLDNRGYLWISTIEGLSRFDIRNEIFRNFTRYNGLQNNQFNYGAFCKLPTGELVFGGISGFNIFDPAKIKDDDYTAPVILTGLRVFNQPVPISNAKEAVLKQSISITKKIELPYNQNVITIEFVALDYVKTYNIQYEYQLDGFKKRWIKAGDQHSATFTNLDPGDYIFRVRIASIKTGIENPVTELKIKVLPPYWKAWWFKTILILFILFSIYLIIYFVSNREKIKNELILERMQAQKLHEIDLLKVQFFTNISHEIRTPLTLIIGPVEKMLSSELPMNEMKNYLKMIQRNANQLLNLINQLLDFRKLETGKLTLEMSKGDIVDFIREVVFSFVDQAYDKKIKLELTTEIPQLLTNFDPDKIEKIINNLLSNALKFTDKEGFINVIISTTKKLMDIKGENATNSSGFIVITVEDTGSGIPETDFDKIFNRFFRSSNAKNQTGTGIGLALVKELTELHKGQITVESKPGKGSKFTVSIPIEADITQKNSVITQIPVSSGTDELTDKLEITDSEFDEPPEKIVLIVEDNSDVRYFIASHFKPEYKVLEASDGTEGWLKALEAIPDVIISDVLMPGMDGKEFCRKIKTEERTSHIPIVLLTALSSKEHILEGLEAGADDYISKPFDIKVLRAKIDNLLNVRKALRHKYTGEMILKPSDITITSPDQRFLQKAIEIIEKNISDSNLNIEQYAIELGVSRMQLYRKMSALTNMTVKEFIRDIRLKRAVQLLIQKKLNISEIAYAVGFRDASHFRKCFKEKYNMNATEYLEKYSNN